MAEAIDGGLPAAAELLIEDVDANVAVALQGPGGGAHEHQRMAIHYRFLQGDGADAETVAQDHHDGGTDDEKQGDPGTELAEAHVERIDEASHAQQGRGALGHL